MTPQEQRQADLAADRQQCAGFGYAEGTDAFAQCMQTASMHRDEVRLKKAALAQQQAQFDKIQDQQAKAAASAPDPIPQFDKNGNPNFDANGNYVGPHGTGALVDNPDAGQGTEFPPGSCKTVGGTTTCETSSSSSCTTMNGVTTCH